MAKKRPSEDRDVLKFKLQVLHDYISHHERKLAQFEIDLHNAVMLRDPEDTGGFARRVKEIVLDLYTAEPPKSLIEADLVNARAEVNTAVNASPEWAKFKQEAIKLGRAAKPKETGFDEILAYARVNVFRRWDKLQTSGLWETDSEAFVKVFLEITNGFQVLYSTTLEPAKHLRQKWIDMLGGQPMKTPFGDPGPNQRGRKIDPKVKQRNKKIAEAWETKEYSNYKQLATKFGVNVDTVRKAVQAFKQKN